MIASTARCTACGASFTPARWRGLDLIDRVTPADVRRALEVQAKSHLIHLREGFLETGGHAREVARLIHGSIGSFATLLINLADLDRADVDGQSQDALV